MSEDAPITRPAADVGNAPSKTPLRSSHAELLNLGAAVSALALDALPHIAIYATVPSRGHVIVYANAACAQHYGVPADCLIGRSIWEFIPGTDQANLDVTMALIKERGSLTFNSLVLRDGRRVPVVVSLGVVRIDGEELCVGFARDRDLMTEQDDKVRRIEIERTVADRLATAVALAPGFMFTYAIGPDGAPRFAYASPRITDLLGFAPEDLSTTLRPYVERIVPEDLPAIRQRAALMALGKPLQAEFRYNHPTKGLRWLEVTAQRASDSNGNPVDHGFMIDVTSRKLAELALRDSEGHYRQIFENTAEAMFVKDVSENGEIRIVAANRGCEIDTARPRSEIHGRTVYELYGAETAASIDRWDRMCISQRRTIEYEDALTFSRGHRMFRTRLVPVIDADGKVHRILGFSLDITEERRAERERHERDIEFQTLVENSPDIIVRYDTDLRRTYVNKAYVAATGLPAASVIGKATHEVSPMDPATVVVFQNYLRQVLEAKGPTNLEISFVGVDGRRRQRSIRGVVERDIAGNITGLMTIDRDMTERVEAERMLAAREREVRTLVENSPDSIARYDTTGKRIYANPAFMRLDQRRKTGVSHVAPADIQRFFDLVQEVVATGAPREIELSQDLADGHREWEHIQLAPEFDEAGAVISVLSIGRDTTVKVEYNQRIQHAAFFDALTGLPNRAMLGEASARWIARAGAGGFSFAVMVLDLDRFKEVNDGLGHDAGDMLLKSVSLRLQACVDDNDVVVRLGGDEFALMVADDGAGRTDRLARSMLTALVDPIVLDEKEIFVSASIGIARFATDGDNIETLLRHADAAMYQAKAAGRNNFQYCSPDIAARAIERMTLTSSLRRAVARGEFELHYQPQITLASGRLSGVEALLRWRHPDHGLIMPDRFIPIAEETGLIVEIGRWVIAQACRDIVAWNTLSAEPLRMSVNLSARQFVMNDLVGSIEDILAETGCAPAWLELEITESLLLEDDDVGETLEALNARGISIAIDDFGTGYSALSYFHRFPIHTLKIDRTFIRDIEIDSKKTGIIRAIISIAQALEMRLVAEGVESGHQAEILKTFGCDAVQGYWYGRPMPAADFLQMLLASHGEPRRAVS